MFLDLGSCAARQTIVVNTRTGAYELVVLPGEDGELLVRGGAYFPEFRRVLFVGSTEDGVSRSPRTIAVGLRMQFISDDRMVTTSAVQSFSRCAGCTASSQCAAAQ
jgi:hypothetical protein